MDLLALSLAAALVLGFTLTGFLFALGSDPILVKLETAEARRRKQQRLHDDTRRI